MKQGQSYIVINSLDNKNHKLIKHIISKGYTKYFELVYATHYSTEAGWTVTEDHGNKLPLWLGFTITESIKRIDRNN